jgi:uncharacterized protein YrrD
MELTVDGVERIDKFVGRAVLSLETANQLGEIRDLLIDPISGELAGLAVKRSADDANTLVSILDIHGIGPDAVIVEGDQSLVLAAASPLSTLPSGLANLVDVKVVTEHGRLLGNIANVFLCLEQRPVFIYEVRSSLFDKLLGRALFFAASFTCAFSDDRSAMVISAEVAEMDHHLEEAAQRVRRLIAPASRAPVLKVEVHTHAK